MKKIGILLMTLVVAVAFEVRAETTSVSLWKAQGDSNTVYLLGSIHLLRREDHPLPAAIEAAYDESDAIYMEIDMDDIDPAAVQASSNRLGLIPGDGTLEDIIGADNYAESARLAAEMDIPFEMLSKTEPWLAAITVEQMALLRIGFNPLYGIEMHMAMKASQDGKPVDGFETIDEQLEFLDGLSLDAQIELLMQSLREGAAIESSMDDLIRAWKHGDVDYLEDVMLESMSTTSELYKTIVADRNHRWADTIETLLSHDDDYLIIVGALHLVGDDGLPALLSARGVQIGQMNDTF